MAVKVRLDAEAGGFRALDLADWTGLRADDWEPVVLILQGVQTEVTAVIEATDSYLGADGAFAPEGDTRAIAMPHGQSHRLALALADRPPSPGLHAFNLDIPVWITTDGKADGGADGVAGST